MSAIRSSRFPGILLVLFMIVTAGCGGGDGGGASTPPATPPSLQGNDFSLWYIAPTGSDSLNTCHTAQSPCKTIQWAVTHATNGANIHIADGSYYENVLISNKGVHLLGSGPDTVLMFAPLVDKGGVLRIECPNCFEVVSISDVTIKNGAANLGGAIYAADVELTITNVLIQASWAKAGGCMYITEDSTVKMDNVTFDGCQASSASLGEGGAIYNAGKLTMTSSYFSDNISEKGGGGLYNAGTATLNTVLFYHNVVQQGWGGGILNSNTGKLTMIASTLTKNDGNIAGGGLANNGGHADITGCTFNENTAISGGGIMTQNDAFLSITDSTLSGNTATGPGGAIASGGTNILNAASLTIAYNKAGQGGGFYQMQMTGMNEFINTIFAFNTGGNCNTLGVFGGINIVSDNTCGFTGYGSRYNVDPQLGPLQGNGGPTMTHALQPSSVAIDTGTSWLSPNKDQRGGPRGVDGNGDGIPQDDVGAFEFGTSVMSNTLDVEIVTATPGRGIFTFQQPGNCRSGPDSGFPVLTSAAAGATAPVEGRTPANDWYQLRMKGDILCWVNAGLGTFDGALFLLPLRELPPTPTPTDVPPTDTPIVISCPAYTSSDTCAMHLAECTWYSDPSGAGSCRNK